MRDAFEAHAGRLQTQDGLLPCSNIRVCVGPDGYELVLAAQESLTLFPVPEADFVVDYLVDHPELWGTAAIRVTYYPSIWGSVPLFAVPFREALKIAARNGHTKSKYFLPDSHREGGYESLLLHLRKVDDIRGQLLQLEAWQYRPGNDFAHYIHALSLDFEEYVIHLDGATIRYSESDLDVLLNDTKKVKGSEYQKFFRIDGTIKVSHMHALASAFLPGEELYNEALNVTVLPNDA